MKKSKFTLMLALLVLFACLNIAPVGGPAMAQDETPVAAQASLDGVSPEKIDAEIARLNDAQVREELLARLHQEARARAEAQADKPSLSQRARFAVLLMAENLRTIAVAVPKSGAELLRAMAQATQGHGVLGLMGSLGLMFAGGFLVEWIVRRKIKPGRGKMPISQGRSKLGRALPAVMNTLFNALNLLAFAGGAVLVLAALYQGEHQSMLFLLLLLELFLAVRVVSLLSGLIFAPHNPDLRWMEIGARTAIHAHRWVMGIAVTGLVIRMLYELVAAANGDPGVVLLMATVKEVIFGILLIAAIVYFKNDVAQAIRDNAPDADNPSMPRKMAADFWHLGAIAYFFLVTAYWVIRLWITGEPSPALSFVSSLLIIPVFFLVDEMVQSLLTRMLDGPKVDAPSVGGQDSDPPADERAPEQNAGEQNQNAPLPIAAVKQNLPVVRRVIRLIIAFILMAFVLHAWGISVPLGQAVTRAALEIFFTLLAAHLLWEFIKGYIQRKLRETPQEVDAGGSLHRSRTLLPLFRKTIGAFLFVVTILVILASLGLNIWPMLAGAGIFGLAIGLGSQSLVKDVVAGIFFLMADTFRVGDYVCMDGNEGYVEKITVRTISVRHYLGALNVVPFGGIKSVTNYTRGPMTVKYKIPLPLGTDPNMVKKLVKEVNKSIEADPEMGPNLLAPLKSQGCKSVQDSVMQFGIKFTAKPGTQFRIKRESLARIQKALAEKGVLFASRAVKIDLDALAGAGKTPAPGPAPEPAPEPAPGPAPQATKPEMPSDEGAGRDPDFDAQAQAGPQDRIDGEASGANAAQNENKALTPDLLVLARAAAGAAARFLDDEQAQKAKKK
jgi:moderate conductance mechanosensitive channel